MDYSTKLKKLTEIVNKHIAEFTSIDSSITTRENSFLITQGTQLLHFNGNDHTFDKIFSTKAKDQRGIAKSYYHYKSFDVACKFTDEGYFTASAMSNFAESDTKEYEHFFEVTNIPYNKPFINSQKNDLYVFCLTEDNKTERFWKDYVEDHKGVCFEFEFVNRKYLWDKFDLRKICYDDGNDFNFYSDLQDEIFRTFGRYLLTPGLSKFGAFYKRKFEFDWERETRLLFNWGLYNSDLSLNSFSTETSLLPKKFIKIPFDNNLFSLKLISITLGKNLDYTQKAEIKRLCENKGIAILEE